MLNKVQEEILTILQEECAEVIQAVSKVRRFGEAGNIEQLEQEVADVLCMINLAYKHGIMVKNEERVQNRITVKEEKLKQFSSIFKATP
jgi:NTP pyrophosphatase (non-canonical NTP hydrolase)